MPFVPGAGTDTTGRTIAKKLTDGSTPVGTSPEQFSAHIKSEIAKWRKLVKDAGLALH